MVTQGHYTPISGPGTTPCSDRTVSPRTGTHSHNRHTARYVFQAQGPTETTPPPPTHTHTPIKGRKNIRGEPASYPGTSTHTIDPTHTQTPNTKNTQTPQFRHTAHAHRFTHIEICKTDCCYINMRDFLGGPVAKTALPVQGAQVWSLVRELDPIRCNYKVACHS